MSTYTKSDLLNIIGEITKNDDSPRTHNLKVTLTEVFTSFNIGKRFQEAPASTSAKRHGAYPGGLMDHAITVYKLMCRIVETSDYDSEFSKLYSQIPRSSMLVVALLHDIYKTGDGCGEPYYVPNILKSGEQSAAIPYKRNDDVFKTYSNYENNQPESEIMYLASNGKTGGHKSLARIIQAAPHLYEQLNEDEKNAIIYYAGAYVTDPFVLQGKETNLQMLLHYADMFASRNPDLQTKTYI